MFEMNLHNLLFRSEARFREDALFIIDRLFEKFAEEDRLYVKCVYFNYGKIPLPYGFRTGIFDIFVKPIVLYKINGKLQAKYEIMVTNLEGTNGGKREYCKCLETLTNEFLTDLCKHCILYFGYLKDENKSN